MFLCYCMPTHAFVSLGQHEIGVWPYPLSSDQDVIISQAGARLPQPQKLITIDN